MYLNTQCYARFNEITIALRLRKPYSAVELNSVVCFVVATSYAMNAHMACTYVCPYVYLGSAAKQRIRAHEYMSARIYTTCAHIHIVMHVCAHTQLIPADIRM